MSNIRVPSPGGDPGEVIRDLIDLLSPLIAVEALADAARDRFAADKGISLAEFHRLTNETDRLVTWARDLRGREAGGEQGEPGAA